MASPRQDVVGAILAGGRSRRFGGVAKHLLDLDGRPLIEHVRIALAGACDQVVAVAKEPLPGIATWLEPREPQHPICGIVAALRRAGGPVLVCAADMPSIDVAELHAILAARTGAAAVVPRADGRLQPLCALYEPAALQALAAAPPNAPLTQTVAALAPIVLDRPDGRPYRNVNTATDLAMLRASRAQTAGGPPVSRT